MYEIHAVGGKLLNSQIGSCWNLSGLAELCALARKRLILKDYLCSVLCVWLPFSLNMICEMYW